MTLDNRLLNVVAGATTVSCRFRIFLSAGCLSENTKNIPKAITTNSEVFNERKCGIAEHKQERHSFIPYDAHKGTEVKRSYQYTVVVPAVLCGYASVRNAGIRAATDNALHTPLLAIICAKQFHRHRASGTTLLVLLLRDIHSTSYSRTAISIPCRVRSFMLSLSVRVHFPDHHTGCGMFHSHGGVEDSRVLAERHPVVCVTSFEPLQIHILRSNKNENPLQL